MSRSAYKISKLRMVARLPNAKGAWPALWLLPADRTWPPEVDVFEAMPWGQRRNELHTSIVPTPSDHVSAGLGAWTAVGASLADAYHECGLDWYESRIDFIFDGQIIRSAAVPPSLRAREMHVLINLAVGGKWVYNELGIPPIDGTSDARLVAGAAEIESDYPTEMVIKSLDVWTQ